MSLIDTAIYDFIDKYTNVDANNIFEGWQRVSQMPVTTELYAVYTCINTARRGTNNIRYDKANNKKYISMSNKHTYQIDIVSTDDSARENISILNMMSRSTDGVDFFNASNLSLLYGDNVRTGETVSETNKYVKRFMFDMYVEEVIEIEADQQFLDELKMNKITNRSTYK